MITVTQCNPELRRVSDHTRAGCDSKRSRAFRAQVRCDGTSPAISLE